MPKLIYPFRRARNVKVDGLDLYYQEPKTLGEAGMNAILDKGKQWNKQLASTISSGGAVLFPHTFLSQCGYQIAAAVHAVLDSGADQVLCLGVLHAMTESLMQARTKELNDEDISNEYSRGVFGPDLERKDNLDKEFSLDLFKILLEWEAERRGIKPPKLIERYPSLVNKDPASLPGIEELKLLSKNAVIVATDDMCHHGVGYGVYQSEALEIDEKSLQFAKKQILQGYEFLKKDQYRDYFYHWMNPEAIGDPTDTAIVLKYLLGDVSINVLDLMLVDLTEFFEKGCSPNWVATALVEFKK